MFFKNAFKESRDDDDAILSLCSLPCREMTKHFHNVITFYIKPCELQCIFSELCSVFVAQCF